jgi:hypothetical protein
MAIHEFTFDDLAKLDGGAIKIAVEQALQDVIKDCVDRPFVSGKRGITINLGIKTICSANDIEEVAIDVQISRKMPAKATRSYRMKPKPSGKLVFNDDAPDSPLQTTFTDPDPEDE